MGGLPPSSHRFPARYVTVGSRVGNCYSAERGDGDGAYAAIEPAQVGIHGIGVGVVGHKSLDQIVKLASPVRTYGKDIYVQSLDVVNLLSLVFLDDDFIGNACGTHGFPFGHSGIRP